MGMSAERFIMNKFIIITEDIKNISVKFDKVLKKFDKIINLLEKKEKG